MRQVYRAQLVLNYASLFDCCNKHLLVLVQNSFLFRVQYEDNEHFLHLNTDHHLVYFSSIQTYIGNPVIYRIF